MTAVFRGLDAVPDHLGPTVVAIGNFDGVHLGHRKILAKAVSLARAGGVWSVALTFDPHPLEVVAPERAPKALTSLERRVSLIRSQGISQIVVLPFTQALAGQTPTQFAHRVLAAKLTAARVVVGANFRFGRRQTGDVAMLERLGSELGFAVEIAGTVEIDGEVVSSTRVRSLVRQGRVSDAGRLLGRPFSLRGPIVGGEGIGSKRTVPTLNLAADSQVLPADGVYVTLARPLGGDACHESVTNVGLRPTFGGRKRTVETFLLGQVGVEAPEAIELEFLRKIREERKFASARLLREQIQTDVEAATRFFEQMRDSSRMSSVGS